MENKFLIKVFPSIIIGVIIVYTFRTKLLDYWWSTEGGMGGGAQRGEYRGVGVG